MSENAICNSGMILLINTQRADTSSDRRVHYGRDLFAMKSVIAQCDAHRASRYSEPTFY